MRKRSLIKRMRAFELACGTQRTHHLCGDRIKEAADRIEDLERVCERAVDELSAWDTKSSADPTTSVGYVVKILRAAVHQRGARRERDTC